MHYRNDRVAQNGDIIVQFGMTDGKIVNLGVLHSATPGSDYCNGYIAPISTSNTYACLCDCLRIDDLAEILKEKGLDKRHNSK